MCSYFQIDAAYYQCLYYSFLNLCVYEFLHRALSAVQDEITNISTCRQNKKKTFVRGSLRNSVFVNNWLPGIKNSSEIT